MVKRIHNRTIDDWQQEFRQLRRKVVYGGGNHLMITRPANGTILDVATKYQCYQLGWLVGVHTYEAYRA